MPRRPSPSRRKRPTRRNEPEHFDEAPFDDVPFGVAEAMLSALPQADGTYAFVVDGQPVAQMRWSEAAGAFVPGEVAGKRTQAVSREYRGKLPGPAPRAFVDPWPAFHSGRQWSSQEPARGLAERAARADSAARFADAAMRGRGGGWQPDRHKLAARAKAYREALDAHDALAQVTRASCQGAIGGDVPGLACLTDVGAMGGAYGGAGRVQCDRVVPEARLAEWALEGAPLGPYDLPTPHVVGSTPCCFYHPATVERMRLQDAIRADWQNGKLGPRASENDLRDAIREAEERHPMHSVWQDCDATVVEAVAQFGLGGTGRGAGGVVHAIRQFVTFVRKGYGDNAREAWQEIREEVGSDLSYRDASALDSDFADAVKRTFNDLATPEDRAWWTRNFRGFPLPERRQRPAPRKLPPPRKRAA